MEQFPINFGFTQFKADITTYPIILLHPIIMLNMNNQTKFLFKIGQATSEGKK